jgi:hypothetical protein
MGTITLTSGELALTFAELAVTDDSPNDGLDLL